MLNYFCEIGDKGTFGYASTPYDVMSVVWDWVEEQWGHRPACHLEGVVKLEDRKTHVRGRIMFEYYNDILRIWWAPVQTYQMAYDGINCFDTMITDYKHEWTRDVDIENGFLGL